MLLFMLILLPLLLITYCIFAKDRRNITVVFAGLFSAAVFCGFKILMLFAHRLVPDAFGPNFVYYFVRQSFLPMVIVYGVFVLLLKDDWQFKVNSCFPLLASFYSINLPYCIITSTESVYSAYSLFIKPLVYAAMLGQMAITVHYFYKKGIIEKKLLAKIINPVFMLLCVIFPAASEALYCIDSMYVMNIVLCIVYILIPVTYLGMKFVKYLLSK